MFLLRVNRLVQDREEQSRREEVTETLNKRHNEKEFVGNTSDMGGEGTGTEGGGGDESSHSCSSPRSKANPPCFFDTSQVIGFCNPSHFKKSSWQSQ